MRVSKKNVTSKQNSFPVYKSLSEFEESVSIRIWYVSECNLLWLKWALWHICLIIYPSYCLNKDLICSEIHYTDWWDQTERSGLGTISSDLHWCFYGLIGLSDIGEWRNHFFSVFPYSQKSCCCVLVSKSVYKATEWEHQVQKVHIWRADQRLNCCCPHRDIKWICRWL